MKKLFALLLVTVCLISHAFQPASTVNVVVPFAPGGGVDSLFRNLQAYAATKNVNLSPVYKPGAGGVVGIKELATLPSDGNTLGISPAGSMAAAIKKHSDLNLTTITGIRNSVWGVVVNTNSKFTSYDILVSELKQGNKVVFGQGASGQLIVVNQLLSEVNPSKQPAIAAYKGAGPAVKDLLGNHIDVIVVPLTSVYKYLESGDLRIVATIGTTDKIKDVVNLAEVYPNWIQADMFGLVVPAGLTKEATAYWSKFMQDYLSDKTVLETFEKEFSQPAKFGAEQFNTPVKVNLDLLK